MNREDLRFDFLRNALYHTARRRVLEGLARFCNFGVLLLGTAAAADVLVGWGITQSALGFGVAVVAAAQFAYDFSGRARTHEYLQRRYYEGLAEIDEKIEMDEGSCARMRGRMDLLSAEEPPTYRALDAAAYNEAVDAIHGKDGAQSRLVVPLHHSLMQHILHFNGADYRSRAEVAAAALSDKTAKGSVPRG